MQGATRSDLCGSTPRGRLSIRSTCWCRARARRSSVIEKRVPNAIGGMTRVALSRHPRRSFQPVTMAPTLSPFGVAVRIIVASRSGEHFLLPYPCRQTTTGWRTPLRARLWRCAQRTGSEKSSRPSGARNARLTPRLTHHSAPNQSALSTPTGNRNRNSLIRFRLASRDAHGDAAPHMGRGIAVPGTSPRRSN